MNQLPLPFTDEQKRTLIGGLARGRLHDLLLALYTHDTRDRVWRLADLAHFMGASYDTARRAVRDGRRLGCLWVDFSTDGPNVARHYAIDWDALATCLRARASCQGALADCQGALADCPRPAPARATDKETTLRDDDEELELGNTKTSSSSSFMNKLTGADDFSPRRWTPAEVTAVRARLRALGMADSETPIRQLQARGVTSPHSLALVEFYAAHPGRWNLGALHHRLRTATPADDVQRNWVPPEAAWLKREREERQAQQHRLWRDEEQQAREQQAREPPVSMLAMFRDAQAHKQVSRAAPAERGGGGEP